MKEESVLTLVVGAICLFAGFAVGNNYATETLQRDAIEANVAEWTIDPKTGEKQFRWKQSKEKMK